jgi:hypothetical protein
LADDRGVATARGSLASRRKRAGFSFADHDAVLGEPQRVSSHIFEPIAAFNAGERMLTILARWREVRLSVASLDGVLRAAPLARESVYCHGFSMTDSPLVGYAEVR